MYTRILHTSFLFFISVGVVAQTPCVNGMAGPYPCEYIDLLSFVDGDDLLPRDSLKNLRSAAKGTADIVFGISFAVNTVTSLVVYDQLLRDKTPAGGLYALAIGSGIIEIWSGITSLSRKKKAILEYNSGFDKKEKVSLVPLGNQNGIGLALKF